MTDPNPPRLPVLADGVTYSGPRDLQQAYFQTPFPPAKTGHEDDWVIDLAKNPTRAGVISPPGAGPTQEMPQRPDHLDDERGLLGAAMASDGAADTLWTLDKITGPVLRDNDRYAVMDDDERALLGLREQPLPTRAAIAQDVAMEFSDPRHGQLAMTILELRTKGQPHDADACIAHLRDKQLLPLEWDPDFPKVPIDPVQYGIAGWQNNSVMHDKMATVYAANIREHYRPVYLEQVGVLAAELGRGYLADPTAVAEGFRQVDKLLRDTPPVLSPEGKITRPPDTGAVDTRAMLPVRQSPTQHPSLRLPQVPVLSGAGRAAVAR